MKLVDTYITHKTNNLDYEVLSPDEVNELNSEFKHIEKLVAELDQLSRRVGVSNGEIDTLQRVCQALVSLRDEKQRNQIEFDKCIRCLVQQKALNEIIITDCGKLKHLSKMPTERQHYILLQDDLRQQQKIIDDLGPTHEFILENTKKIVGCEDHVEERIK